MSETPVPEKTGLRLPTRIEPHSATELLVVWTSGEKFALPYLELRFQCPCAACVDEHTGKRVLKKESLTPGVRPTAVQLVGRYAVQVTWSDGHQTGMYHYDRLFDLCGRYGLRLG